MPLKTAYVEVTGSLLFGAGDELTEVLEEIYKKDPVWVVVVDVGWEDAAVPYLDRIRMCSMIGS